MDANAQLEFDIAPDNAEGDGAAALARLLAAYRPVAGSHDELLDGDGRPRAHWRPFLNDLAALGDAGLDRAISAADRHLSDNGVVYRVYEGADGRERPWPLSHLPMVMPAADWAELARGVAQRAALMEAVLADLAGPARLVASGAVPAALVAGNPEFLRPLAGVTPRSGRYLSLYAVDVSRGPDGRWWVLADRTQAPSGLGYAVENRIALYRALPDMFERRGVVRLADFIQRVRSQIAGPADGAAPSLAVLTPGPANETYFEHAYLARVLGFPLVEGGDLAVVGDTLWLRDVEGARRIDVLLRRVDAGFMDPLELNTASRLGVPGLVHAVRAGGVTIANALGSGLVEMPALRAFIGPLSERLTGKPLSLPSLATWWLGDPAVARMVASEIERFTLAPAFGRTIPGVIDSQGVDVATLEPADRQRLVAAIARRGMDFVAQEPVRLGTTPVIEGGRLAARPCAIRVFAVNGPDGWTVMPGGLGRIADKPDARTLSMQRGGRSADVWVLGRGVEPPAPVLMAAADSVTPRRDSGGLPARAADNLFWLGRYLERLEATLRVVRNLAGRTADDDPDQAGHVSARRLADLLAHWGAAPNLPRRIEVATTAALTGALPGAAPGLVDAIRRTATAVRDRLSPDAWRILGELKRALEAAAAAREAGEFGLAEAATTADEALRLVAAFFGMTHETMYRRAGWRFLDLGGRIERGIAVARFARRLSGPGADANDLERLLELTDTRVVYRSRYLEGLAARPVLDLVLVDDAHPRSVTYQARKILEHLGQIVGIGATTDPVIGPAMALVDTLVKSGPAEPFGPAWIEALESGLMAVSDAVTRRWFLDAAPFVGMAGRREGTATPGPARGEP